MRAVLLLLLVAQGGWANVLEWSLFEELLPQHDDWQVNKSLIQCNEYLFRHKVAADVTFMVSYEDGPSRGTAVSLQAHKLILMSRSPVFFTIFFQDNTTSAEVAVTDIDPDAFNEMLRFMYYEEAEITAENVLYLIQAAKKYKVSMLSQKCSMFLNEKLDANNVFSILEHSIFFKDQWLIDKCLMLITKEGHVALQSKPFSKLSFEAISKVLSMNKINAKELDIFKAIIVWAEAECEREGLAVNATNLRQVIGQNLYKIRFPTMALEEFADNVVPTAILSVEEGYAVFQYLVCSDKPEDVPFPTIRRQGVIVDIWFIKPDSIYQQSYQSRYHERQGITIAISKAITLKAIYIHGVRSRYLSCSATIGLTISQNSLELYRLHRSSYLLSSQENMTLASSVYPYFKVISENGIDIDVGQFVLNLDYGVNNCNYDQKTINFLKGTRTGVIFEGDATFELTTSNKIPLLGFKYKLN